MTRSRNTLHSCVSSKKRHLPNFTVELKSIARKQIKQALKATTPASFKQPNRCQVVITASTTKCRYGPLHVSTRSYRPEPEQKVTSVSSCPCSLFRKAEDFDDEMKIIILRKEAKAEPTPSPRISKKTEARVQPSPPAKRQAPLPPGPPPGPPPKQRNAETTVGNPLTKIIRKT